MAGRRLRRTKRNSGEDRNNTMKKNYNYTRRKLFLPEYGRHIHEMIDSLMEIEDRRERNRQARAVIAVMGESQSAAAAIRPILRTSCGITCSLCLIFSWMWTLRIRGPRART